MNKKGIGIILLGIVFVTGIFFYVSNQNIDQKIGEKDIKDENIIEQNNNMEEIKEIEFAPIEIGEPAPDFTLENMQGEQVTLSELKGKNVLINFWATWCPYCIEEMPDLQKLYNENKDNDFVVLAIDVGEPRSDVEEYLSENPYEFPVLLDKDGKVSMQYLVRGIPTSYMIDKEGMIRGIKMSMLTYPEMKQMLDSIKDEK
ncbi:TlpA disulfide reductase family protein [Clostridiaceae bacterium 35-E11]